MTKKIVFRLGMVGAPFLFLFFQCEKLAMDRRYPLFLKNDSPSSIRYYIAFEYKDTRAYPDTSLPGRNNYADRINPGEKFKAYDSGGKWSMIYKDFLPSDTLSVFVFSTDTLERYSWEIVKNEYKILKRYDLSLQDLEQLKYTIAYPPSPEMAKMKMYPRQ